jgi:hypothetical protein
MRSRSVSQYLKELDSFSALATTSTTNRPQLAWPHFQGPPTEAAQDAAIYDHGNAAKIYLFLDQGTINALLVPHLTANDIVTFAIGDRPSNLSHFKTTKDKFGAGIWSVMTKATARTNGFVTSSTPIADAKTAADDTAGLSDVDLYKKLGFEAYDGLAVDDWGPVCAVIPITMPLPPGCPTPHRLALDDMQSINGYIDNLMQSSKMSGPVCAWVEAQAYLFDKTGGEDFLTANPNRSMIDGTAIDTDNKQLPSKAGHQSLEYEPIHPISDHDLQAATKARFDSALTVLGTKSLNAQGFRVVESAPLGGGGHTTTDTATESEDEARARKVINKWRLHFARLVPDPATGKPTVVLPQALSPRFTSIITSKNLDDAQARLKEMFRAQVPINSDCTFLSLTVGCSELADHALASAFKNYNLSDTAPACKDDLTNTLSPIFHACHLDRENAIVIKHLNELDRIAREDKTKDTTTKRKTDLQAYGLRASLPDLQRALGTTQYWAYCIMTDFVTDPNKPVIDRIATTYLGILRDEMGASFIKRMTQIYPHCVTQIMSILQSYQSMIQSFVNCVPEDFDELTIDPAIFQAPLEAAMHAARDLSLAITAKQPPPTLSNDTDRIPPIYMDLYPPAKRAIEHPQGPNQRLRSDPSSTRGTGILRSPSITNNNNNNNNSGGRTDGSDKSQSTGLRIAPIDADNPPRLVLLPRLGRGRRRREAPLHQLSPRRLQLRPNVLPLPRQHDGRPPPKFPRPPPSPPQHPGLPPRRQIPEFPHRGRTRRRP